MDKFVIIVAGGKGTRMGGELPKQFIPIFGKPILMHTLEAFYGWDSSARIILVLPAEHQSYWKVLCEEIGCKVPHVIANGGSNRFESVKNGLSRLDLLRKESNSLVESECVVAIHDGVRPFVPRFVIENCFKKAVDVGAVIPVVPMVDSLRIQDKENTHPVDRSLFMAVQTPQVFQLNLLKRAYNQSYNSIFTDDASVVEAIGEKVTVVEGSRENIKITTPLDLLIAKAMFNR